MNRRQLLQAASASLALPAVPTIAVAAPAGPTVTSLLAEHEAARARYEAAEAPYRGLPEEPENVTAELERMSEALLDLEALICRTPPRDGQEAVALLRFVREHVVGDPYTADAPMSQWADSRDFVALDNVLTILEGMVQ